MPKSLKMDVYFSPTVVIEIRCAQVSQSKTYSLNKEDAGISLRFPRFLRIRPDKAVGDSTLFSEISSKIGKL